MLISDPITVDLNTIEYKQFVVTIYVYLPCADHYGIILNFMFSIVLFSISPDIFNNATKTIANRVKCFFKQRCMERNGRSTSMLNKSLHLIKKAGLLS